jgi:hypothetical protein
MRTPQAIQEISYLGPEPDRWRPETALELSKAASPDHVFRYEAAISASPLPRRRYDFLLRLDDLRRKHPDQAAQLTPQYTGTLPWQVEEIYERLVSAFIDYRLVQGEIPPSAGADMIPMGKPDLPYIEDAALYYAGWLGHYVGDGSMPLHTTVNSAGWVEKDNPNGYTTSGAIHHQFEVVTDQAIEDGSVGAKGVESYMRPAQQIQDSFGDTLRYLRTEGQFAEQVYSFEKVGAMTGGGTPELHTFIERRIAEGAGMLRDLIYSAWLQSKDQKAPELPLTVALQPR